MDKEEIEKKVMKDLWAFNFGISLSFWGFIISLVVGRLMLSLRLFIVFWILIIVGGALYYGGIKNEEAKAKKKKERI